MNDSQYHISDFLFTEPSTIYHPKCTFDYRIIQINLSMAYFIFDLENLNEKALTIDNVFQNE